MFPTEIILPAGVTHSPQMETHLPATDTNPPPPEFILSARVTHSPPMETHLPATGRRPPPMETHLPATDRQAPPFLFGTCWGEYNSPLP